MKKALLACLAILFWQAAYLPVRLNLDSTYSLREVIGLHHISYENFLYFFKHFGEFPVGTQLPLPVDDQASAERFVQENGQSLLNDLGEGSAKIGNYGKIFLYWPEVLIRGTIKGATVKSGNIALFVGALLLLYLAFHRCGEGGLGILLVLLIGSNPFQVFNTYRLPNVFSTAITATLIVVALNSFCLITKVRFRSYYLLFVVLSGIVLGLAKEVRSEAQMAFLSFSLLFLVAFHLPLKIRLLCSALLLSSMNLTSWGAKQYFDYKFESAQRFIQKAGGFPYYGPRQNHHVVWHTIANGLGDFDTKYGYRWDDRVSYRYSVPKLNERFDLKISWAEGGYFLEQFWDKEKKYPIQPEDLWQHEVIMKERVLGNMVSDPLWYGEILWNRIKRIMQETTPARVSFGSHYVELPFSGWLAIFICLFLALVGEFQALKVVLAVLPLSLTSLIHYSGGGATYYGLFHTVALAGFIRWLISFVRYRVRSFGAANYSIPR